MNRRVHKRRQKAFVTTYVPIVYPLCTVTASLPQLEDVGCSTDLSKLEEVHYIKDYPTGYAQVRIERKDLTALMKKPMYEFFDIPKHWIKLL